MRLADVLRRTGRPYEAEDILGECRIATAVLVAERPSALRYRIADANTWAFAAALRADTRPAEAELIYRRARRVWNETISQYPSAKDFVSGVHGFTSDWDHFQQVSLHFAHLPAAETDEEVVDVSGTVFFLHSSARAWARSEHWEESIRDFERSASQRTKDHAYDWLLLAIAHANLAQLDKAQEWLEKADESISRMADPHVELIELRDLARSVVDEQKKDTDADDAPHPRPRMLRG